MIGGVWEAAGAASLAAAVACAVATTIIIAVGTLCGWRAALGGIGPALLAGAVIGYYGPALMGSRFDVDLFLLGLTLLLCGAVPAVMAFVQEKRRSGEESPPPFVERRAAAPPPDRRRARTGASP